MYENGDLQFFGTPEGYVQKKVSQTGWSKGRGATYTTDYQYVFQYSDHLGNVRLSYSDTNGDNSVADSEIIEESNYYPFGLKHLGYNESTTSGGNSLAQQWKYNNRQFNQSANINLYEMDLRQYDPAIARWTTIDPVTHYSLSTYNGYDNNPVIYADPSGGDVSNHIFDNYGAGGIHETVLTGSNGYGLGTWSYTNNGWYVNNLTHEWTKDWRLAISQTLSVTGESSLISIDFASFKDSVYKEFGIGNDSKSKGYQIVSVYLANITLWTYIDAVFDIVGGKKSKVIKEYSPTVPMPESVVRKRGNPYEKRNWLDAMKIRRDYGVVLFSSNYAPIEVIDGIGYGDWDYGYIYVAGKNVHFPKTLISSPYSIMENVFDGYKYIEFLDSDFKHVGALFFRTESLKEQFLYYYEVTLKERFMELISNEIQD